METDYARGFNAAIIKAFAASDANVRLAYFELADFYRRKLCDGAGVYPTAEMLRSIASESCSRQSCWCK